MNRLLTTIVVGLAGIQSIALAAESRPKLLVGIVVDQLRTDYLENLKDMLGPGGFRRLMEKGVYIKDLDFMVPGGDATSASAIIQTGTYPRQNGITGGFIFDAATRTLRPIFQDESFIGNFTNETYSPAALRVTTLTDELSIEEGGKTRIHSIAPEASQAIVLAGHTGNSAFWINDESGRWSSTTYYTSPPSILQDLNYVRPLISRLDTLKWTPLYPNREYPLVDFKKSHDGFKYTFSRADRDVFSLYKNSPIINSDITKAAKDYLTTLNLGKNWDGTDVLNIAYTLAPYPLANGQDYRYELEDAYLRLDKDLEDLFTALDKLEGNNDILIYLVSTGYFSEPAPEYQKYRIPGGTFSVKRAMSLLNSYYTAKYGNAAYVDHYANNQIYLSKSTLEEKQLDLDRIAEEGRDFLVKMSGVADAFTQRDLMSPALTKLEAYRLAIDPKTAGEIILEFNPGWNIVDDSRFPTVDQKNKTATYLTPGFILSNDLGHKVVEQPVAATAIAPTVAGAMKIRPPNSSVSKPINF